MSVCEEALNTFAVKFPGSVCIAEVNLLVSKYCTFESTLAGDMLDMLELRITDKSLLFPFRVTFVKVVFTDVDIIARKIRQINVCHKKYIANN